MGDDARVVVGDRVVDVDARRIWLGDTPVHVEPQTFDVLVHLLANAHRVVTKAELLDEVWRTAFVTESALTTRIKELRRALGDDGRAQRVIRTIHGRGYQLIAPTVPAAAPAAGGVAVPLRGLHGRDADVLAVSDLLGAHPAVVLVGPGGVGKTALAREVAARWSASGPVHEVDLSTLTDPSAVVPAVLHAAAAPSVEAVAAAGGLVLLDCCEHVLDAAAAAAEELLRGRRTRVLATSRERLGVVGEHVWQVRPLPLPHAAALLRERAAALAPGVPLDPPQLVESVVDALDGLPLAVEMAAGRLAALGLEGLADEIARGAGALRAPTRAGGARHRTLQAVIEWSEALLDDRLRRVMGDLAVFSGPVRIHDVLAVVPDADPGAVADLVERSLLVADHGPRGVRYRMLQTIRQHARGHLVPPGRLEDLRRRHAIHLVDVAEAADRALHGPHPLAGHQLLDDLSAELRDAHAWARQADLGLAVRLTAALQRHAHERLWAEPASWARELAAVLPVGDARAATPWAAMANDDAHRGAFDRALRLAEQAIAVDPDGPAALVAVEACADIALYRGDLGAALAAADRLAVLAAQLGEPGTRAMAAVNAALALAWAGDPGAGLARLAAVEPLPVAPALRGWVAYARGEVLAVRGDRAAAEAHLARAIALADDAGSRMLGGVARVAWTSLMAADGDPGAAVGQLVAAVRSLRRHGGRTHLLTALRNLVPLLVDAGAADDGARLLGAVADGAHGAEAALMARADSRLQAVLGAARLAVLAAEGGRWSVEEAADEAIDAVERLRATR